MITFGIYLDTQHVYTSGIEKDYTDGFLLITGDQHSFMLDSSFAFTL
jgi:hypothetical protein